MPARFQVRSRARARYTEHVACRRLRGAAAAVVLALGGCGGTETEFAVVESPTGAYVLRILVEVPHLPHAQHVVRIYASEAGADAGAPLVETKMPNDGVPFTEHNIGVRWTGATTALVCLRPTDLPDRGIRVTMGDAPDAVIKPGC